MREIKFRAWLEGTHGNLTFENPIMDYDVTLNPEGFWCDVEGGWDIHGVYYTIPIMQFTGMKDRNGKEIYDGDVIDVDCSGVGGAFQDGRYVVKFFLPDCAFCLEQIDGQNAISFNECYDYEVVGNVYENPELLKKK